MKRRVATCLLAVIVAAGCGDSSSSAEPGTSEVLGTTVVIAETTPLTSVPATTSTTSVPVIPIAAAEETVSSTTVTPVATITPEGAFSFPADESGDYFEVEFEYDGYLCRDTWEWEQYECVGYTGGPVPSFLFPDLYCSGSRDRPDCSEYWYPNEFDDYDLRVIGGFDYLCQRANLGGWDDYDCVRYTGGDPPSFYSPDLYCSDAYGSLECDPGYYPAGRGIDWEGEWEDELDQCWEDYWEDYWEDECW